uniref:Trehalase n=1 Tax=Bursaphelenchus xylophilus TaxID=6326 RepID=A0A1I7SP66_BURXY
MALFTKVDLLYPPVLVIFPNAGGSSDHSLVNFFLRFGFVPNGGRIYYTRRSQPPTLIPSVYQYYQSTGDVDFVKKHLATLEKEYIFWCNNRMKEIDLGTEKVQTFFYDVPTNVPRPESFSADLEVAQKYNMT